MPIVPVGNCTKPGCNRKSISAPKPRLRSHLVARLGAGRPLPYRPDLISFTSEAAIPKPTFQNIARLAGVGTATVERVLNGRGGVRPGLAEKVTAAAEETPRSMKTKRLCSKERCGHEDREPVRGVLKR
jgi:hypothetical protein